MEQREAPITFEMCVMGSIEVGLLDEYNRLYKKRLLKPRAPIEMMVDKASGYEQAQWNEYFRFVHAFVWIPLLPNNPTE